MEKAFQERVHLRTDIKEKSNIQKKHRQKPIQTNTEHIVLHNTNHDNTDIINHTIDTKDDDALVILANDSDSQKNVLRKGLKFIPKPKCLPIQTLHTDIRNFMHRLKAIY